MKSNEFITEEKSDYSGAIAKREELLARLETNPPPEWTPEYVQKNIDLIKADIERFKDLQEDKWDRYVGKSMNMMLGGVRYSGIVRKIIHMPDGTVKAKVAYYNSPDEYFYKVLHDPNPNKD